MTPEDRSKLQSFISDIDKLRSRSPEEKKFKDWKNDVEKKLEDVFGKSSEQLARFRRVRFFDFARGGRPADSPLSENDRRDFFATLDDAKRVLRQFV
jgi:hypothetical protein